MTMFCPMLAAALLSVSNGGVSIEISPADPAAGKSIDPARSVILDVSLTTPPGVWAELPDLRDRVRGFSLAEPFEESPSRKRDGTTVRKAQWRLVPEPCAKEYKIAPFAVEPRGPGAEAFVAGPLYFDPPAPRAAAEGPLQIDPRKDLPPLSWRLVAWCAAVLLAAAVVVAAVWALLKYLARRVREHMMSPIERARAELDRLMKKGLPGRGRYKDFYVELTMVVRRYVQRKYGVKAPHLTTTEFLEEFGRRGYGVESSAQLKEFLESADLVKFAGVQATPEMADSATDSARTYLEKDNQ